MPSFPNMRQNSTLFALVSLFLLPASRLMAQSAETTHPKPLSPKRAQEARRNFYSALTGNWKGELVYRDYTTNKEVTLPTLLEMKPTQDKQSLRLHFIYDDGPGKTVEETEVVTLDAQASTYSMQSEGGQTRVYRVTGLETFSRKQGGTLILLGTGRDNDKPAEVRNSLTLSGNMVTMLHEVRTEGTAFLFRNRYRFTRVGKETTPPKLSAEQLQADFAIFKRAYQELHPGLYRYNTKAQMDAHFAALEASLNHAQTLGDAYLAFATCLSQIKCGHCYPNFYNQPDSVVEALYKGKNRVPFFFRWIDRRMIVTRNLSSDPRLVPGTEVLAINGIFVSKILDRLLTVSRADGSNIAKRINNLDVHGDSRYEAFDIYYPLLFSPKGSSYKFKVNLRANSVSTTVTVNALTHEQRIAPYQEQIEAMRGDKPLWEFKFLEDGTAYLRMSTWAVFNSKWDWKGFLEKSFAQLEEKGTRNLFIDLRGNEGGADVGDVILSKLTRKDLRLPNPFVRWVRYQKVPDDLKPYLDTWDRSFMDWGSFATDPKEGFYRMTKYDDDAEGNVIKPDPHPFAGRTFVLIDASNSSATFQFAAALKETKLATLVGQQTGGSLRGINGGAFFFLRLPNSKIETDLPLIGAYPRGARPSQVTPVDILIPDAGVVPDIVVAPKVEDIQRGIDTELRFLQSYLLKNHP